MTTIAIILFAALVAGYPFHRRAVRRAATQAEVRAELRDSLYAEIVEEQRKAIAWLEGPGGSNVVAFERRAK